MYITGVIQGTTSIELHATYLVSTTQEKIPFYKL